MIRRATWICVCAVAMALLCTDRDARGQGQQPPGRVWGNAYGSQDWDRFYHYPYVFYPHNYWGFEYYRSADSLYYRYPPEMRIPVYNKKWHNELPAGQLYNSGHHFMLDMF